MCDKCIFDMLCSSKLLYIQMKGEMQMKSMKSLMLNKMYTDDSRKSDEKKCMDRLKRCCKLSS